MKAYHGTLSRNKDAINANGFNPVQRGRKRLPNDLGVGVYSFIYGQYGDPKRMAQAYISHFVKLSKYKTDSWVVFELDISEQAVILDLDNETKAFNQFRSDNEERIKQIIDMDFKGKQNNGLKNRGNFDGIVIKLFLEYLSSNRQLQLDGVKKDTFTNISDSKYKQSNFYNGTELCIYKLSVITGFKEV